MGRWSWSDRNVIEDCRALSVFSLNRFRVFSGNVTASVEWSGLFDLTTNSIGIQVTMASQEQSAGSVRLAYTLTNRLTGNSRLVDYSVELRESPCNFGGVRYWFVCPLQSNGVQCSERIAKLFLPPGGTYFGCRKCHNLTYRSQKEGRSTLSKRLNHLLSAYDRISD